MSEDEETQTPGSDDDLLERVAQSITRARIELDRTARLLPPRARGREGDRWPEADPKEGDV